MAADEPEPPGTEKPKHLAVWRATADDGRLDQHDPGEVVRALRQAKQCKDERLESDLACHLSDVVIRELKKRVKASFPDGGRGIVEEVHFKMMEAILDPTSPDGEALPDNFGARLHFRFLDALKRQRRRQQFELPPLIDDHGAREDADDPRAFSDFGSIEVAQTLALVKDERKRLAFLMTMKNESKGEIAKAFGIDPTTLLRWIKEVRAFLKTELNL